MTLPDAPLAIVVPAYKAAYLKAALESLAAQDDPASRIYVFDDCSPEGIRGVAGEFGDAIRYRRFEANLGGTDLAGHWNRCIDETTEPWIWLFSDDDVADPGCLAAFRSQSGFPGVFRFDTKVVDDQGRTVEYNVPHPETENCLDYAYYRFRRKRSTTAVEYIFRRSDYEACGKFDSVPLAWGSDVMMWIKLGESAGIRTVKGPVVGWRRSALNLSPDSGKNIREKIHGSVEFYRWTREFFADRFTGDPKHPLLMKALDDWIADYVMNQSAYLPLLEGMGRLRAHAGLLGPSTKERLYVKMVMKKISKAMKRKIR